MLHNTVISLTKYVRFMFKISKWNTSDTDEVPAIVNTKSVWSDWFQNI